MKVELIDFFQELRTFQGIKRDVYEGGIRIPMVAWCPGTIKAGLNRII